MRAGLSMKFSASGSLWHGDAGAGECLPRGVRLPVQGVVALGNARLVAAQQDEVLVDLGEHVEATGERLRMTVHLAEGARRTLDPREILERALAHGLGTVDIARQQGAGLGVEEQHLGVHAGRGRDLGVVLLGAAIDVRGGAGAGEAQHVAVGADRNSVVAIGQAADPLDLRPPDGCAGEDRNAAQDPRDLVPLGRLQHRLVHPLPPRVNARCDSTSRRPSAPGGAPRPSSRRIR
jgi:hypothetical protein